MNRPQNRSNNPLTELWHNRQLLLQFTVRNLELRHRGSVLGIFWSILNPLVMLAIYVTVFGYIFGGSFPEDPINTKASYALTIFLGLTIFHYTAEIIALAPSAIVGSPNLVKKVVFPLSILPASIVASATVHFLVSMSLVVISAEVLGVHILPRIGWIVVTFAPLVAINIAIAFLLASLGVFLKDLFQITQFINLILLYSSAVFFSVSHIPPNIWAVLKYNPYLEIINETRQLVFWDHPPGVSKILYTYGLAAAAMLIAFAVFRRLRHSFSDSV